MSNEILFLLFMLGGSAAGVAACHFGRIYLYAFMITITLYIGITEAKVIEVLGFPTTLGTALYGVSFFCSDMLTEHYGKKAGYQGIRYCIFAAIIFQIFLQGTLLSTAAPEMAEISQAMDGVFTASLRIVLAGLLVYAIAQSFDVWLYDKINAWTKGKHLWLRNNGSTVISQALDTYLFTFLAFSPQFTNVLNAVFPAAEYFQFDDWIMVATIGYAFKLFVALSDTPFMYISKMFPPRDLQAEAVKA
jgi:uncharacterized integral membrane protein (TIGR00697 family)